MKLKREEPSGLLPDSNNLVVRTFVENAKYIGWGGGGGGFDSDKMDNLTEVIDEMFSHHFVVLGSKLKRYFTSELKISVLA